MTTPRWPRFVAGFLGLLWFLQIGGGPTLNPTNVGWVLSGDLLQHWLGWLLFRNEPWTFPLGRLTAVPYPIGTTIGFTDSNPLVSLLLKPFSSLMPADFQFIGPWLAFCFIMQGYMGAALTSTVTKRPGQQVLGGWLVVLSPVLLARLGHDTLCAHWLLLGLMYLGLRAEPDPGSARRSAWLSTGAAMLASAIHPYLATMCWVLAQALYVRLWRSGLMTLARAGAAALATTAGMLAVFGAIGYFGKAQLGTMGFGSFSSDLLTLVDPAGFSRVLPSANLTPFQWEGLGYLGLGGVALFVAAAVVLARRRPSMGKFIWPVVAACALMGLYALSSVVTLNGHKVLRVDWLTPRETPFRASGRFIWPLHYLALMFGVWGVTRGFGPGRQSIATALLAAAVALQAVDLKVDPYRFSPKEFQQARLSNFNLAVGRYRHLALFPMQVLGVCGDRYEEDHAYRYMLLAYRLKTTYNSGIFARTPVKKVRAECRRMEESVTERRLDPQTIYVVSPAHLSRFKIAGAACGRFDGDWICVSHDSDERYRAYVEAGEARGQPAR
ncbi:MAG TPA: DUF6311 domain-containing protein [Vicinamibacterales bacterium]